jgi:hypothetical protein
MTNARIVVSLLVAEFRADPSRFLSENVDKTPDEVLVRVLNRAGFYCRTLDVNRWTKAWVRKLAWGRNNPDLCAEIAALGGAA